MVEYECTCGYCGATWIYNEKHEQANKNARRGAILSGVMGGLEILDGRSIAPWLWNQTAREYASGVQDYSQCPRCGSADVSMRQRVMGGGDYATELTKYKNLLDSGAISPQEFEFFKQNLLGN